MCPSQILGRTMNRSQELLGASPCGQCRSRVRDEKETVLGDSPFRAESDDCSEGATNGRVVAPRSLESAREFCGQIQCGQWEGVVLGLFRIRSQMAT